MINYPHIIYLDGEESQSFHGLLNSLNVPYKVAEGGVSELKPGGTYIVFGSSAAAAVSERLGLELSYSFTDSGLPKGAVPLLSGGEAYGGILEASGGTVIMLQPGAEKIIAAGGERNRVVLYLSARREDYEKAYAAEQRLDMAVAAAASAGAEKENAPQKAVESAPATEKAQETIPEKPQNEDKSTLDAFLFYGKNTTAPEKVEEPTATPSWDSVLGKAETENPLEEFIKEKPRKVMDPSLLSELRDDPPPEKKKKGAKGLIIKIIALLLVLGILGGGGYWYFTKDPKECDKVYKELAAKVGDTAETDNKGNLKKYSQLAEINKNFAGYLTLPEAPYGLPVVSLSGTSAEKQQSVLFDGTKNSFGTVYTKSDLSKEELPSVILLQSENRDDYRMLGGITKYLKKDFAKKHPTILFDTKRDTGEWAVFSAFSYKKEEPFLIDRESFLNDTLFLEYINNYYKNSVVEFETGALADDTLLILVAKGESDTTVLATRLLRPGETANNLQERVYIETAAPESNSSTEQTTDNSSSEKDESKGSSSKEASSKTDIKKPEKDNKPTARPEGMRYEQTGLTSDMDQSVKVQMSNVVTILNVTGLSKTKATSILKDTLGVNVEIKEIESAEKRGTVLKQSVAEGAELSVDIPITLTVSKGLADGKAMVPDLVGNAQSNAPTILEKYELELGKVTEKESSLEAGTILSQSVEPETEVGYGTKIDLVVSDGKGEVKTLSMPKLTGKTEDEAKAALKSAGLRVGKIKTVTSSKSAGTVVSQECPSGEKIAEGETVGFSISNGSKVNNLTVTNISSWSITLGGKSYAPGDIIKGDYMDIIPYIVEAEMGGGFNTEALKAQAIAAYCWLLNMGSHKGSAPGVPMKNPTDKVINAAESVKGLKVKHGSETAQTYYYAIAADYSANCKDVWWADISYLRAVPSEGDKHASGYETTVSYTASELKKRVKDTYGIDLSGVSKSKWFSIKYDENNAYVRSVNIGGKKTVTGSSMRDSLLNYELRSTAFKVKYNKNTDKFTFTVRGYGHGVGMSQVGANYYAGKGWDYERILTHYYPGTSVQ